MDHRTHCFGYEKRLVLKTTRIGSITPHEELDYSISAIPVVAYDLRKIITHQQHISIHILREVQYSLLRWIEQRVESAASSLSCDVNRHRIIVVAMLLLLWRCNEARSASSHTFNILHTHTHKHYISMTHYYRWNMSPSGISAMDFCLERTLRTSHNVSVVDCCYRRFLLAMRFIHYLYSLSTNAPSWNLVDSTRGNTKCSFRKVYK